jgi:hypothetical protein
MKKKIAAAAERAHRAAARAFGRLGEENGETNIIAIILIIIVVIGLAVIFREQLTGIVSGALRNVGNEISSF